MFASDAESMQIIWQASFPDIADGKLALSTDSSALLVYQLGASNLTAPSRELIPLQPIEPAPSSLMTMHTTRYDESLTRIDRFAPPPRTGYFVPSSFPL